MPRVVVAGSDTEPSFAAIDFSAPDNPSVIHVAPDPRFPFGACRVAIDGALVAVGDPQGGDIRLVDVANPSQPTSLGFLRTNLSGIAAIAISGNRVAVGELFNARFARVLLIDISSRANPAIMGSALTPFASFGTKKAPNNSAISGIVFRSDTILLVTGPSDPQVAVIDFTSTANPVTTNFAQTHLVGSPAIDFDRRTGRMAAGDGNGSHVNLFDSDFGLLATFTSNLFPVSSVALSDSFILAGSSQDPTVAVIPLDQNLTVENVLVGIGPGLVTALDGNIGACGGTNSALVNIIDLATRPAQIIGAPANVRLGATTTIGISSFGSTSGGGGSGAGTTGAPGAAAGSGSGGQGGGAAGASPGIPAQTHIRPVGLRNIMGIRRLDPAVGLRAVTPPIRSVFSFCLETLRFQSGG